MMNICFDATASAATGRVTFRWPYPSKDWSDNVRPIEAMNLVQKAIEIFSVPAAQWQDDHNRFFVWMLEATMPKNIKHYG